MGKCSWILVAAIALLVACGSGPESEALPAASDAPPTPSPSASPLLPTAPSPVASATPRPLDRWTSFGPAGGDVAAVAVDPGATDAVYAGTSSGLWRSEDGAESWERVDDYPGGVVSQIAVQEPSTLIVVGSSWLVYRKRHDEPWVSVNPDVFGILPIGVGIDRQPGGSLYLVNLNLISELPFLYRSDDLGDTWTPTGGLSPAGGIRNGVASVQVHPGDPDVLLAGQAQGGAISRDRGVTWERLFPLPSDVGTGSFVGGASFSFDALDAERFWVGFSQGGVFETVDGGESWTPRNDGIATNLGVTEVFALAASLDESGNLLCGTADEAYRSEDGGQTWIASSSGLPSTSVTDLVHDPDVPGVVYAGTRAGGVARSVDSGETWAVATAGLFASRISAVAVDASDPPILYAGMATGSDGRETPAQLFRSLDRGRNWEPVGLGSLPPGQLVTLTADPAIPSNLLAVVEPPPTSDQSGSVVLRSEDFGVTWQATGLDGGLPTAQIAVQPGTGVAIAAIGTLHRSSDGGRSWAEIEFELPTDFPSEGPRPCPDINAVAIDPHDTDRFYAASAGGVLVSEDAGETWHGPAPCSDAGDLFGDGPPLFQHLVVPDPVTPGRVYASFVFQFVVSEDGGETFEPLQTNLPLTLGFYPSPVGALAHDGERLYAVASAEVYRSTTDDTTWEYWDDVARSAVTSLVVVPGDPPTLAGSSVSDGVLLRDVEPLP